MTTTYSCCQSATNKTLSSL